MVLGIYGAGGLGREVLDLAKAINKQTNRWNKIIFIDDNAVENAIVSGINSFRFELVKEQYSTNDIEIAVAVGEPRVRGIIRNKVVESGYHLATLIHPVSMVSEDATLSAGVIVQYNAFVSSNVIVGENTYLQPFCTIGHDTHIGENCVISTYDVIAGDCRIGNQVYIGLSVPVKEQTSIGENSIIGMGAVVLRDIPECVVALGNPARPMQSNDMGKVFGRNKK